MNDLVWKWLWSSFFNFFCYEKKFIVWTTALLVVFYSMSYGSNARTYFSVLYSFLPN